MNTQPVEKQSSNADQLDVVKVWRTIQGEGPFAGCPAIFIRLAGCNLQCPLCDTDYTSGRFTCSADELAGMAAALSHRENDLVVITGGEPFRQDLCRLINALYRAGFAIQIETNGTVLPPNVELFPWSAVSIVCSPKAQINAILQRHLIAVKYVVQADCIDPDDGLPLHALGLKARTGRMSATLLRRVSVYVQPADEQDAQKNAANLQAAIDSCMKFGYRLCIQTHKLCGLE